MAAVHQAIRDRAGTGQAQQVTPPVATEVMRPRKENKSAGTSHPHVQTPVIIMPEGHKRRLIFPQEEAAFKPPGPASFHMP
ncbi:hypothetical protein Ctu_3p00210 (plasmid) [Cronobacter turicensis z3032]|uniref:Uncharacterized protein n=2 Tax=Cronobacter TaxID=413496 RepID=C9Y5T1_CROTZ|nr:hypothetical protein Ctu_3p00210 [Cronobacter turicensis z3032]